MKQARPSLDVFLPVSNIGKEQIAKLEQVVADDSKTPIPTLSQTLSTVLKPAVSPRAKIITAQELANIHEALGQGEMDEDQQKRLGTYIGGVLRSVFGDSTILAPDLAPTLRPFGNGKLLMVAPSEEVVEGREILKATLPALYSAQRIPENVLLDDWLVTGVWLGQSDGPVSNGALDKLYDKLIRDDTIFEARTEIQGPVQVRPNPSTD